MSMEISGLVRAAIVKDDPEDLQALIDSNASVFDKKTGYNALMMSAEFARPKTLALLLTVFDPRLRTGMNFDALDHCIAGRCFWEKPETRQQCRDMIKGRIAQLEADELRQELDKTIGEAQETNNKKTRRL